MTEPNLPPQAGYIDVDKLLLISHETGESIDIKGNYIKISIDESIRNPYVEGYIDIVDSHGLIYNTVTDTADGNFFHVRGEEYLHIEYYDYETFNDATQLQKETYFIYAIEEIEMLDGNKETALQYRLFFTSPQKVFSDTKRISKAYRNMTYSQMVEAIYEEYYTNLTNDLCPKADKGGTKLSIRKDIEIEETKARFTIVFPGISPQQAIQMIGRRAYSEKNSSSYFMFFETREKFYFCTSEYLAEKNRLNLIDEAYSFEYSSGPDDNSPAGQYRAQNIISNGTFPSINSIEAIQRQAYSARISEIDLSNRDVNHYYYQYALQFLGYENIEQTPALQNSNKFISETTGDTDQIDERYVFKDYANIGEAYERPANYDREYPYYKEAMSTKPVFDYHFHKSLMNGTIPGRGKLYPGVLINVKIPQYSVFNMKEGGLQDKYFGGDQMVAGLSHTIMDNVWQTNISYSKALRGGGRKNNTPGSAEPPALENTTTPADLLGLLTGGSTSETSSGSGTV